MESIAQMGERKRGGTRLGAGRPRLSDEERAKWFEARGLSPATAQEILAMANERKVWQRLFDSPDDSIVLRTLMYLTDRRDGKAAQTINVTSQAIVLSAKDLESARAIIAEIRGTSPNLGLSAGVSSDSSLAVSQLDQSSLVSPVEASVQADDTARQGDAKVTEVQLNQQLSTQRA